MLLNYLDIMSRLKNKLNLTEDKDIAKLFGISSAALSTRKKNNSIPFEHIIEVCSEYGISIDYIIKGNVELLNGVCINDIDKKYIDTSVFFTLPYINDINTIKEEPNIILENIKNHIVLPQESYPELQLSHDGLCAVTAHGNSMDGNISNGALMLIKFLNFTISSGCVYVLILQDEILVRRIFLDPNNQDKIIIKADNYYYPEFIVHRADAKFIGKVIAVFNSVQLV